MMMVEYVRVVLTEICQEEKKKKRSLEMTIVQCMVDCKEVVKLGKQMIGFGEDVAVNVKVND